MTNPEVLSAIEQELVRIESYVATLRDKVHALQVTAVAAQDNDQSSQPAPRIPVMLTSRGAVHQSGFWFAGEFQHCHSQIDIYIGLLRALAQQSDDALPRAAATLRELRHSRSYLARDRAQLFQSHIEQWARAHSRRIIEGWYADTNLSLALKKRLLRSIFQANGLREGVDVVIVWRNTPAAGAVTANAAHRPSSQHH